MGRLKVWKLESILVLLFLIGELGKMFWLCLILDDCVIFKYIYCVDDKKRKIEDRIRERDNLVYDF